VRAVKNFLRYYETIRHLRPEQLFFFLVKPLRRRIALYHYSVKNISIPKRAELKLHSFLAPETSLSGNKFTFLNREKNFEDGKINWNFLEYGLLWNYHLNYFDFLLQENLSVSSGLNLMRVFIANATTDSASHDPYPISLRGINWIKFLVKNNIDDSKINESLFRQYTKLSHETERHLGANHLLENGFSLLFAAYYFQDKTFLKCAENILRRELNEQILEDGAHFELSTMYHRIILHRILDCINLVQNNKTENNTLQKLLSGKASAMLSWIKNMTFTNGVMPDFNDSTSAGASHTELYAYAQQLGVNINLHSLSMSGYRKFSFPKYELILDAGNITPSYNPGHTHADTFNFCLNINERPVIVDCGTSTYENNSKRKYERSTEAHNTISVNGLNQSDVWASFRIGRRAKIIDTSSTQNSFIATMKGFTLTGIIHKRQWEFAENKIFIIDSIAEQHPCRAFLHFHPEINIKQSGHSILGNDFSIVFKNYRALSIEDYDFAEGFNKTVKARVVVILFSGRLHTEITL
jgi:hypothetical protein